MGLPLSKMVENLFGVKSTPNTNPVTDNVDTAVTKILSYNPNRLSFVVFNLSGNNIFIAPDNLVSSTRGIYLAPNGGSASLIWDRDFELCSMEWYGVAGANDSEIYILENVSTD